jgi:hypothetical protein
MLFERGPTFARSSHVAKHTAKVIKHTAALTGLKKPQTVNPPNSTNRGSASIFAA